MPKCSSFFDVSDTEIGPVAICADNRALLWLEFHWSESSDPREAVKRRTPMTDMAFRQLNEYFDGKRREFDVPTDPEGTEFQRLVWDILLEIPFGKVMSYGQIADQLGRHGAARAVGRALSSNPLPIFVPCHRVITSDGRIGGFSGGLDVKRALLKIEGISI